jgi:L-glyceraldehyde 3-phosphate reductase
MLNRWIEDDGLLDVLEAEGAGCIVFSPLAQGVLFGKYLTGIPEGSRATHSRYLSPDQITKEALAKVRALGAIAEKRGQALAQMALAWTLRDPRVTSAVIGVSSIAQLEENRAALEHGELSSPELEEIDRALSS